MTAKELSEHFGLDKHIENGSFLERHYESAGSERATSGSIYYYVDKDEKTEFHRLDCDEYWCYIEGTDIEVWMIDENGSLSVSELGVGNNAEPMLCIKKGTIFAAKHKSNATDGTFICCITVPRFSYTGFELILQNELIKKYPFASEFFK